MSLFPLQNAPHPQQVSAVPEKCISDTLQCMIQTFSTTNIFLRDLAGGHHQGVIRHCKIGIAAHSPHPAVKHKADMKRCLTRLNEEDFYILNSFCTLKNIDRQVFFDYVIFPFSVTPNLNAFSLTFSGIGRLWNVICKLDVLEKESIC